MSILESSNIELIINPKDEPAKREWILEHISNPEVKGICMMHGQPGDKADEEFFEKANKNLKVVSTFSVGFGLSFFPCDLW